MSTPSLPLPNRPAAATWLPATVAWAALLLAGCASGPKVPGGWPDKDGPDPNPPPNLMSVPDAEPRVEMIRTGGPNKPYEVLGRSYVPITSDSPVMQVGLASWYGRKFHGKPTASGELYNMYSMTAAHPTLPIPSYARVRNPANGKEVIVRVNDRGPFHSTRVIDLSYTAALKLGLLRGVAPVQLERLTNDEIRAGTWRRPQPDETLLAAAPPAGTTAVVQANAGEAPAAAAAPAAATAAPPAAATPSPAPANGTVVAAVALPAAPVPEPATQLPLTQETAPARVPGAVGFWVQLGAFKAHDSAVTLQRRVMAELDMLSPLLAIFNEGAVHRLQAGPYATRDDAAQVAQRLRSTLQLAPIIVQRR